MKRRSVTKICQTPPYRLFCMITSQPSNNIMMIATMIAQNYIRALRIAFSNSATDIPAFSAPLSTE